MLSVASDATALLKNRVIQQRVNASGSVFGIYEDGTLRKKGSRNSRTGDRRINFSDTNRMWNGTDFGSGRGVVPVITEVGAEAYTIVIEPENDPNRQEVLGYLQDRFGPIIEWSEEEINILVEDYQQSINQLFTDEGIDI